MSKHQSTAPLASRGQYSLFTVNTRALSVEGCPGNAEQGFPPSVSGPFGSLGFGCRGALGIVFLPWKKKTRLMKTQSLKINIFMLIHLGFFFLLKSLQSNWLHFQKQVTYDEQYIAFYIGLARESANLHQLTITQIYSDTWYCSSALQHFALTCTKSALESPSFASRTGRQWKGFERMLQLTEKSRTLGEV